MVLAAASVAVQALEPPFLPIRRGLVGRFALQPARPARPLVRQDRDFLPLIGDVSEGMVKVIVRVYRGSNGRLRDRPRDFDFQFRPFRKEVSFHDQTGVAARNHGSVGKALLPS